MGEDDLSRGGPSLDADDVVQGVETRSCIVSGKR